METKLSLEQLNNVAEIDIVYRTKITCKISERPKIIQASDAYQVFLHYWNTDILELMEEFKVMFMNQAHRVLQIMDVSRGGITGTVADPRVILAAALRLASPCMIIAHNHPSGNLNPSKADEELTQKIKHGAALMDIKLLDHVIVTPDGFYSFAENGIL